MQNVFCAQVLPSLHSLADWGSLGDVPEEFDQRLLLFRLAKFWNVTDPQQHHALGLYDPVMVEERYERFCKEFLAILPTPFALNSATDNLWKEKHPRLPFQRLLLHIAMFESLCHNFKPVLLLDANQIHCLQGYKQDLALVHIQTLARAAVKVLDAVSALHALNGTSYTHCSDVIFQTFEAAVILVCVTIMHPEALSSCGTGQDNGSNAISRLRGDAALLESMEWKEGAKSSLLERCTQATQEAFSRLTMLAEVSVTAEIGALHLGRLIHRSLSADNMTGSLAAAPMSMEPACMEASEDDSSMGCGSGYTLALCAPSGINGTEPGISNSFIPNWENLDFAYRVPFGRLASDAVWSDDHLARRGQPGQKTTLYMQ